MIIKVCGLLEEENYQSIIDQGVSMVGINFYQPSSRFISNNSLPPKQNEIRIGVYVRATMEEVELSIDQYDIDVLQLHGDESVEYCKKAQALRPVIKVWRVDESFDWTSLEEYGFVDAFLFDTKTVAFGGSGKKFDWSFLSNYNLNIPFLLSGGISAEDAEAINRIDHPMFRGVDINSRFETAPGIKDARLVASFIKQLRD